MILIKFGSHMMITLFMFLMLSLGLNAEGVLLNGKGVLVIGKGNPLSMQKFAVADFSDGEWRKVVVTADMIGKDKEALADMHFFALVDTNTDNLIQLKEIKKFGSVQHNILAAITFKDDNSIPKIIQNDGKTNIAVKMASSITNIHYLATNTKVSKPMSFKSVSIAVLKDQDENTKIILTSDAQKWQPLLKISFNHINIIKAQPHKFRANAADRLNTNSIVAKVENNATYDITASGLSQNNSNMFMVATFNSNTRIGNRDKTGQHMLHANIAKFFSSNPVESGNKSGKIMLHANAAKITLDPYNTEKKFGQPLDKSFKIISFYGSKAGAKIGQQGNTESGKIMINANLKAPVETSNGRHVSLIITPLAA